MAQPEIPAAMRFETGKSLPFATQKNQTCIDGLTHPNPQKGLRVTVPSKHRGDLQEIHQAPSIRALS